MKYVSGGVFYLLQERLEAACWRLIKQGRSIQAAQVTFRWKKYWHRRCQGK